MMKKKLTTWNGNRRNMTQSKTEEKDKVVTIKNIIQYRTCADIFDIIFDSGFFFSFCWTDKFIYSAKESSNFLASETYMRQFIRILLLTRYLSSPQEEMFWSLDRDVQEHETEFVEYMPKYCWSSLRESNWIFKKKFLWDISVNFSLIGNR